MDIKTLANSIKQVRSQDTISNYRFKDGKPMLIQSFRSVNDNLSNEYSIEFLAYNGVTFSLDLTDVYSEKGTLTTSYILNITEAAFREYQGEHEGESLDLTSFFDAARSVKPHTIKDVFFHLAEEVGEVATCIQRPHKAVEPLVGELADVLNCTLDIYYNEYGEDLSLLQQHMDKKCAKWKRVQS